jgi:hypothetical protein
MPKVRFAFLCFLSALGVFVSLQPLSAETIDYKGRKITVPDGGKNELFLESIRKAIDIVEKMPPKLKALGGLITDLRYDPTPSDATNTSAYQNITGVYIVESKESLKGHIQFFRSPVYASPANYAKSIVGNGVYRQRHAKYIEARKTGDKAYMDYYENIVTKKDLKLTLKAECEVMDVDIGVTKALEMDPKLINALTKERSNRGCANGS